LQIQDLLRAVDRMAEHAPCLRDAVVLRLLRETGARLHEVLALTAGGCRRTGHALRVLVRNKGSLGRETKLLYLTPSTERLLHAYIRTERARIDPRGRQRLAELDDADPIFLTRRGRPYTSAAFRYHWHRLVHRVRPRSAAPGRPLATLTPHMVRHLHVTEGLRMIRELAAGDAGKLEDLERAFQMRMAWRSPQMLDVYNLALDLGAGIATFQERYVQVVEAGRAAATRSDRSSACPPPTVTPGPEGQRLLRMVAELEAERWRR
jgi:Phage integrase family